MLFRIRHKLWQLRRPVLVITNDRWDSPLTQSLKHHAKLQAWIASEPQRTR